MNDWTKVIEETVPQYALKAYGAVSVLFNADEDQELIVAGYASPQVVDREKHLITKQALAGDLERFLAHPHYRNAMLLHSNVQVGEVLPRWCHPETGECWETKVDEIGLFSVIKIRTDAYRPKIVDKVIEDIRAGRIASFSISADAPFESRRYECVDGACFWIIDKIEYYEITLCETPVNQDANFTILTKSMEDEFKASAFCQDGSCPIDFSMPDPNLAAYKLRKAEIDKGPVGGGGANGFRGDGVADPVKPIPAAAPKQAIDPRKPQQADVGAKAGGNAGATRNQIAKDMLTDDEDSPTHDTPDYADNQWDEGEMYYLNNAEYVTFGQLETILEKALNELDLGEYEAQTRLTLSAAQRNPENPLKSFSYVGKSGWIVWTDMFPTSINKAYVTLDTVLEGIALKAADASHGELMNDALILSVDLHKRMPLRGERATESFNSLVSRALALSQPLDEQGLVVNSSAFVDKGYNIGWVGNAQRAIENAIDALRLHIINNEQSRLALAPDILASLDVLYEDMQACADNLGLGRELEKFAMQGDRPQLEIIAEVANSTVTDVQQADLLLEKVDEGRDELADADQVIHHDENQVITNAQDGHSEDGMIAWFLPEEIAAKIALADGEGPDQLHMTLAYIPDISFTTPDALSRALAQVQGQPLIGKISGVGRFSGKEGEPDVCYLSVDAPGLSELRERIVRSLAQFNIPVATNHGFSPHITMKYINPAEPTPIGRFNSIDVQIDKIIPVFGGQVLGEIPLGQQVSKAVQNRPVASSIGAGVQDIWEPTKNRGNHVGAPENIDTIAQGTHTPMTVIEGKGGLTKNLDKPNHIFENTDFEEHEVQPVKVENRQPRSLEYDGRHALKAGEEDAKAIGLSFARLFHRALNDKRYKLAIVKDEDDGSARVIDLGY